MDPRNLPRAPDREAASGAHLCAIEATAFHHGVGHVITGWIQVPAGTAAVQFALLVGRQPLRGTVRFVDRVDLRSDQTTRPLGFEFCVDRADAARLAEAPVVLVLRDGRRNSSVEKRLSPTRWIWAIETIGENAVSGWAVDLLKPDLPPLLILRDGQTLVPTAGGHPRPDVTLAPGVVARSFAVDFGRLRDADVDNVAQDWAELCVGDLLNPVVCLRRGGPTRRTAAVSRLAQQRKAAFRVAHAALLDAEARFGPIRCMPRAALEERFESSVRAPSLLAAGFERAFPDSGQGQLPEVWLSTPTSGRHRLAVVCKSGIKLSPSLEARGRRLLGETGNGPEDWYTPDGIRDLPRRETDCETLAAFPFLKPHLTPRVLAQAPELAPLLLVPAAALDGWRREDGWGVLVELLLRRLGPPTPLRGALYLATGSLPAPPQTAGAVTATGSPPTVSFIVPSRDNVSHLAELLAGLARLRRRYRRLEVVLVDNNSKSTVAKDFLDWISCDWIRVVRDDGDFNFSRLSNFGAGGARGEVLLFCNDDIVVGADFDLAAMVSLLEEPHVGVVGHTLVYEDGTIQHAGVVVGAYGVAYNGQTAFTLAEGGYFGLARLTREVSAVTGAFLAIRRPLFQKLGRFNEQEFAVNFNDVDLCLRAREAGYSVLNSCCGTVVHRESVSRAHTSDRLQREIAEGAALRRIWRTEDFSDLYYAPDFDRYALPYTQPNWVRLGLDLGLLPHVSY